MKEASPIQQAVVISPSGQEANHVTLLNIADMGARDQRLGKSYATARFDDSR